MQNNEAKRLAYDLYAVLENTASSITVIEGANEGEAYGLRINIWHKAKAENLLRGLKLLAGLAMPANYGSTREQCLNYIGAVDAGDWGTKEFNLSSLFTREELAQAAAGVDFPLQLAVELCTENTNGALATRVRLRRVEPDNKVSGPYR